VRAYQEKSDEKEASRHTK